MKFNKWTLGLAAVGVVSLASAVKAEEQASSVMTALSSTTLSGYVNTSAHWVPGNDLSTSAYGFGGRGAKDDGFNLNVVDLKIAKPLDESEWAAGYTAELWFGPDANLLGNASTTAAGSADFGVKQAYVALRAPVGNGLDLKLGVWDCPMGFEVQNAGDNPNYTRSWGWTIEPTQHTGLLASYKVNDWLSIVGGIANTWDSVINGRAPGQSMKTYTGVITLTAPESFGSLKGATLTGAVIDGRTTGGGSPDRTSIYIGATVPTPLEGLAAGIAYDHLSLDNRTGFSTRDTDVVGGYLSYKATEKVTVNGRVEYISLGGNGLPGTGDFITGGAAFAPGDEFLTTTVTVDYALWKNVISRLEYRWDHDLGANGGKHFESGTSDNEHLIALNVIYKF